MCVSHCCGGVDGAVFFTRNSASFQCLYVSNARSAAELWLSFCNGGRYRKFSAGCCRVVQQDQKFGACPRFASRIWIFIRIGTDSPWAKVVSPENPGNSFGLLFPAWVSRKSGSVIESGTKLQPLAVSSKTQAPDPLHLRTARISLADEQLELLPEGAVWWKSRSTVLISDTHFGKEATFRAASIPVPDQTLQILHKLEAVLTRTAAEHLMILGDLIHARRGRCEQTFRQIADWRERFSAMTWTLIRGNHDVSAGDPPAAWRIRCLPEPYALGPFVLCHKPEMGTGFSMAGHLHPVVRLTGPGRDSLRLPCFLLRKSTLILPAFSSFVDGKVLPVSLGDQVFVIADHQVTKVA